MSNADHSPSNRPVDGAKVQTLGHLVGLQFHPAIKLDRKKGLEFAGKLAGHIDPRGVDLSDHLWTFSQPLGSEADGRFQITVQQTQLAMEATRPTDSIELFERRYVLILKEFLGMFKPALLLGSGALIRGTLQIDGDARQFLTENVTRLDTHCLQPLGRPVHLFGIRLFMPPFRVVEKTTTQKTRKAVKPAAEWQIDVKAESLIEDPSKLFLEANAEWQTPRQWDSEAMDDVAGRLEIVSNYLQNNFRKFLENATRPGEI